MFKVTLQAWIFLCFIWVEISHIPNLTLSVVNILNFGRLKIVLSAIDIAIDDDNTYFFVQFVIYWNILIFDPSDESLFLNFQDCPMNLVPFERNKTRVMCKTPQNGKIP